LTYSMLLSSHRLIKVLEYMVLACLLLALMRPRAGAEFFGKVERVFQSVARQRWKAIALSGLIPLAIRAIMLPWYPPPPPQIHDEFSYLLQGDTFAHGRVANPTPPYWQHFESEYVLLQPVYASQYQPAQGVVIAAGQVILGNAWFGVWLSIGVMCATLCWALRYVFPPTWALFGALIAGLQFGIFGLWMNSYFGGAAAASAGSLILGSLIRARDARKAPVSAAACATGLVLLFASRPFEGLLWTAIALCWFLTDRARKRQPGALSAIAIPFVLVFLAGAGILAGYNKAVTGNAAQPPYIAYQRIYGTPQPFWWQPPLHVAGFDFPEIRDNYLNQLRLYEKRYSLSAVLLAERDRLRDFWRFFIGPFLTPALLFLPFALRDRRIRPWLWVSIPFILDKATYHAWFPAQNAPATILILIVIVQCWRHMRVWWRRRDFGIAFSRQLIAGFCLAIVLGGLGRAVEPVLPRSLAHLPPIWESLYPARRLRDDVNAKLEAIPGKHLVFVRYSPNHCFCEEWVFNSADIRSQRTVYVRPYTPESDRLLAEYLNDRDIWSVEPDEHPYRLSRIHSRDTEATEEVRSSAGDKQSIPSGRLTNDLFDFPQHEGAADLP
jgi:hypothetical protein